MLIRFYQQKKFIVIYIHNLLLCILLINSWTETIRQKKNLISNLWFVNNKYIDGFTDRQSALNFF